MSVEVGLVRCTFLITTVLEMFIDVKLSKRIYSRFVEAGHRVIFVFVSQCPILKDPRGRKVR